MQRDPKRQATTYVRFDLMIGKSGRSQGCQKLTHAPQQETRPIAALAPRAGATTYRDACEADSTDPSPRLPPCSRTDDGLLVSITSVKRITGTRRKRW
jgi:hypothetical protein